MASGARRDVLRSCVAAQSRKELKRTLLATRHSLLATIQTIDFNQPP